MELEQFSKKCVLQEEGQKAGGGFVRAARSMRQPPLAFLVPSRITVTGACRRSFLWNGVEWPLCVSTPDCFGSPEHCHRRHPWRGRRSIMTSNRSDVP